MALDAATLALTAKELEAALPDVRIEKILQPTRDEVLLQLRSRAGAYKLLLSARSGSARVCLTQESYENPAAPPSFCMLLRKHLNGGRLQAVRTLPGERIAFFDFICANEMGDLAQKTLAAELLGRYCNLVLISAENKVIDALKRVDFEDSDLRQLLPGLPYTLPPRPDRLDFCAVTPAEMLAAIAPLALPVVPALQKTIGGIGPVVLREAVYRAFGSEEKYADALSPADAAALASALADIRADWEGGGHPCLVLREGETPVEFSFTRLTQYLPGCVLAGHSGFSALLEAYYARKDRAERLAQKSRGLRKSVQNLHERALRKQAARRQDLAESEKSDYLRVYGELLTANLHLLQKGDREARLLNWYTGEETSVPLDIRLTPGANAQRYFKEYKKRQTAIKVLKELLQAGEHEIIYLETVLYELEAAEGEAALEEIRTELKTGGYLKHYKPKGKKQKPADFWRYVSADGFTVLAGRDNLQNDRLSLKTARGRDMWFHVQGAPGSHVVVLSEGKDIPLPTQNEAAMLAVYHSSQRNSAKVPVDYTFVKHLRKTAGLPPGLVLYDRYETAYITVEDAEIQPLLTRTQRPPGEAEAFLKK